MKVNDEIVERLAAFMEKADNIAATVREKIEGVEANSDLSDSARERQATEAILAGMESLERLTGSFEVTRFPMKEMRAEATLSADTAPDAATIMLGQPILAKYTRENGEGRAAFVAELLALASHGGADVRALHLLLHVPAPEGLPLHARENARLAVARVLNPDAFAVLDRVDEADRRAGGALDQTAGALLDLGHRRMSSANQSKLGEAAAGLTVRLAVRDAA